MRGDAKREMAEARIAYYRKQKATCEQILEMIDRQGMTCHEAVGDRPMRDVTAQRREDTVKRMAMMDELIELWSRDLK